MKPWPLLKATRCFHTTVRLLDLYKHLGVSRNASTDEIRDAYKRHAKRLHPDVNKAADAHEQFARLGEAHEVLSDPERRRLYDLTGSSNQQEAQQQAQARSFYEAFGRKGFGGPPGYEPPRKPAPLRPRPTRGKDVTAKLKMELQETLHDRHKQVHYNMESPCPSCSGTGSKDNAPLVTCGSCDGEGFLPLRQGPFVTQWERCAECDGTGRRVRVFCPTCRGKGMASREVPLDVPIPAGARDGQRIVVPRKGHSGPHGGPPGDLILEVSVAPHEWFMTRGTEVHLVLPIPLLLAITGGPYRAITLHGEVEFQVPPGTQYGDVALLKGYGLRKGDGFGDQYVHLAVLIPTGVEPDAAQQLQQLLPPTYPTPDILHALRAKFEPLLR
eukprot:EG_transcript_12653